MSGTPERSPITLPEEFFQRLKPQDAQAVHSIVETIRQLAENYGDDNNYIPGGYGSAGFFGVYAIGGYVSKAGERPDIDLLVVTNAHWKQSYNSPTRKYDPDDPILYSGDHVAGSLQEAFEQKGYRVVLLEHIPSDYDEVGVNPKSMLRLTPAPQLGAKPIDVAYVKTTYEKGVDDLFDFEEEDTDGDGNPLPRIPLLQVEDLGRAGELRPKLSNTKLKIKSLEIYSEGNASDNNLSPIMSTTNSLGILPSKPPTGWPFLNNMVVGRPAWSSKSPNSLFNLRSRPSSKTAFPKLTCGISSEISDTIGLYSSQKLHQVALMTKTAESLSRKSS